MRTDLNRLDVTAAGTHSCLLPQLQGKAAKPYNTQSPPPKTLTTNPPTTIQP